MKSPLALDKKTVEELKIPPEVELHPRQKLAFLEDQLGQLKSMHWRSRVDMLHDNRLMESSIGALKNKGLANIDTHKNEVEQTIGAIKMINVLIEELKLENPDLGSTSPADYPE